MRYFFALFIVCLFSIPASVLGQTGEHPRVYITNDTKAEFLESIESVAWKKDFVEKKKERLVTYIQLWEQDPEWLVSRLQMNWKTKHDKVFLKGGKFSYSEGSAPVPTVRFSGSRDWATDYRSPKLEQVLPYSDDPKGIYLEDKKTGKKVWVKPSETGNLIEKINDRILSLVEDAAFLYWLTDDQKYAEFAVPVFQTYMEGMYHREAPLDLKNSNQQRISGLATFEVIHERSLSSLITAYDFLHDYLTAQKKDLQLTETVFQRWGDQIIVNGIPDNNWNLFQARYLTYVALVLDSNDKYENGKGKEYFLKHTFDVSTERQLALRESLLVYDQENGFWPESPGYSVHVMTTLLRILTLLDNSTNANELGNFPIIEKAALASFQYLFPTGYMVGFGDTSHKGLPAENFELLFAHYKKYKDKNKADIMATLIKDMVAKGKYEREANSYFELFFYADEIAEVLSKSEGSPLAQLISPTFYAPNVSMFNQRMGNDTNATMVSTVGSFGNHAHANGIAIEVFANNYVLGPDMGKGPSYWHPHHREYYSRFPAHNTVIVDGISDYNAMRSYQPFALDNAFPASGETSNFDNITFSKVSFTEPKTASDQQRFTAIIKSPSDKPYIIDVFRSRKQQPGKQKHEYFYHNIGESLTLTNANGVIQKLTKTEELSSKMGDAKGYDYFTDKKKLVTSKDIQAVFKINKEDQAENTMKVWIKGSKDQQLYTVKAPKSNAISKGTAPKHLLDELVPTVVIKRNEAAWTNPFAVVLNPYTADTENPIENIIFASEENNLNTQRIHIALADGKTTDKVVLNTSTTDIVENESLYQKGLVSVIREEKEGNAIDFIFISGMEKFEYHDWSIVTSGRAATVSIHQNTNGFSIENDTPVTIGIPYLEGEQLMELQVYQNDQLVTSRFATVSRNNPKQQVIRLAKPTKKAKLLKR